MDQIRPQVRQELPEDLRTWIDAPRLVRLALEALDTAEHTPDSGVTQRPLPSGPPRAMLALLTYAYAIGLYSTDEIEHQLRLDPELRYLSARNYATGQELRRFRREQRNRVQRSLHRLLEAVWRARAADQDAAWTPVPQSLRAHFEEVARTRIDAAILADSIALDI